MLPAILLLAALASFAWFLRGDRAEYARMKALTTTAARQRRYAVWTAKSFVRFGVLSVVALALLGQWGAVLDLPPAFAALADRLGIWTGDVPYDIFGGAAVVGGVAGASVVAVLERRRKAPVTIGEFDALLPRNASELALAALLSVNAGVGEELFFRLLLPLLVTLVTGSAVAGFAGAAVLFGLAHFYQGWKGIAATFVLGLVMTTVYLATRSLVAAMLLHALIDLNALVVRPLITGRIGRAERR